MRSSSGAPLAFFHKTRRTDRPNETVAKRVVGEVAGKVCVLTDDMIDTGGTIAGAVKLLKQDGAGDVIIAATHGVLSGKAIQNITESALDQVIFLNTVPGKPGVTCDKIKYISVAHMFAEAISHIFMETSVSTLFN